MQRGVSIDIVLSNTNAVASGQTAASAPYPAEDPSEVNQFMLEVLMFDFDMLETDAKGLIARQFRVASIRYSAEATYPVNAPIPNHAKTVMVDGKVFYIGSRRTTNSAG